jgi:hypothetical protein
MVYATYSHNKGLAIAAGAIASLPKQESAQDDSVRLDQVIHHQRQPVPPRRSTTKTPGMRAGAGFVIARRTQGPRHL